MSLETQVADLVTATNSLTGTVNTKIADIDAAKNAAVTTMNDRVTTFNSTDLPAMQAAVDALEAQIPNKLIDNGTGNPAFAYYDGQLINQSYGMSVDPNDPYATLWTPVPGKATGYNHFYPSENTHCVAYLRRGTATASNGYYEDPQFATVAAQSNFQLCFANDAATSDEINAELAATGQSPDYLGSWWDGSWIGRIGAVRVDGHHPYSRLYMRIVNREAPNNTNPNAQWTIASGISSCSISVDKVVNFKSLPSKI